MERLESILQHLDGAGHTGGAALRATAAAGVGARVGIVTGAASGIGYAEATQRFSSASLTRYFLF